MSPPGVERPVRQVPWWAALLVGVGGAVVGLAPWLVQGARLPVHILWGEDVAPELMPVVLLPSSERTLVLVYGLVVMGSAVAGVTIRSMRTTIGAGWLAFAGLIAAQTTAVVQTATVLGRGLRSDTTIAFVYLLALVAVALIAVSAGMLVYWLIARAPRGGAVVGFAGAAVAAEAWIGELVEPMSRAPGELALAVLPAIALVAPVLTGLAIAWAGIDTVGRVAGALIALAIAWVAPAVATAVFNAAGSRMLVRDITGGVQYGVEVFVAALLTPEIALRPIAVVVVVAAVGLVVRGLIARRVWESNQEAPTARS